MLLLFIKVSARVAVVPYLLKVAGADFHPGIWSGITGKGVWKVLEEGNQLFKGEHCAWCPGSVHYRLVKGL